MSKTKQRTLPITAAGRRFTDDEARIFNHAVALIGAHGRQEAMFAADAEAGELADAEIGDFRIERMVLIDNPTDRKVEIGVSYRGKQVLRASFEQWRRPKRRSELAIHCEIPTFVRGEWEAALLQLR
ncbi:MAG TPA: hypothetical protein VL283_03395 [Candidatus Baltobacteraceae bacterium]|nr:hypothetical protein [Candidatus Baltobacteraceae bacterium]